MLHGGKARGRGGMMTEKGKLFIDGTLALFARSWRPRARPTIRCADGARGLYTRVLGKLACSGQKYRSTAAEVFGAAGVATISGKIELFWALCRGGVEICLRTT